MSEILYELLFVNLLLVANGIFSMSELAVVSSRRARLQRRVDSHNRGAAVALELANNPNSFMSTVQIGITLVGILAGAFGGAGLTRHLAAALNGIPLLAPYSEKIAFFAVVALITYLSLVIGELVPKRLALSNPEGVACAVAKPMLFLSRVARPIVWLLDVSSELLVRILPVKAASEPAVTEEEIKFMVRQAVDAGVVERAEQDIVHNVFALTDQRISRLMTPRASVLWLNVKEPNEKNWAIISGGPHTYFPACDGALDRILGIVSVKHLWAAEAARQPVDLKQLLLQPLYVPQGTTGLKLLELFKQSRKHFAIVIDEYGGVRGVVTLQDVLEAIVGDIPTHADTEETIVRRHDGSWLLDGLVGTTKLKEVLKIAALPEGGSFETVGGFLMHQLGHVPRVADRCEYGGWRFEVVDMDGNRVDKVMATPLKN